MVPLNVTEMETTVRKLRNARSGRTKLTTATNTSLVATRDCAKPSSVNFIGWPPGFLGQSLVLNRRTFPRHPTMNEGTPPLKSARRVMKTESSIEDILIQVFTADT